MDWKSLWASVADVSSLCQGDQEFPGRAQLCPPSIQAPIPRASSSSWQTAPLPRKWLCTSFLLAQEPCTSASISSQAPFWTTSSKLCSAQDFMNKTQSLPRRPAGAFHTCSQTKQYRDSDQWERTKKSARGTAPAWTGRLLRWRFAWKSLLCS